MAVEEELDGKKIAINKRQKPSGSYNVYLEYACLQWELFIFFCTPSRLMLKTKLIFLNILMYILLQTNDMLSIILQKGTFIYV